MSLPIKPMVERRCLYCNEPIGFVPGKGWLHPNGQYIITRIVNVFDCTDCGHQFRSAETERNCPQCGEANIEFRRTEERDDHAATPNFQARVR